MPDDRSFLDIVTGVRAPLQRVAAAPTSDDWPITASLRAVAVSPSTAVTVCTGVAILGLCAAIYGTSGSLNDKRIAGIARDVREHAAPAAAQRNPTPAIEPSAQAETHVDVALPPSLPAPQSASAERSPAFVAALAPIGLPLGDPQTTSDLSVLRGDNIGHADGHFGSLWARIVARDADERLNRLGAAYDELSAERDRLRELVNELELALSQMSPPQAAKAPDSAIAAGSTKIGAAVIAFPGTATTGASGEQPRPVLKNFTTPGSVPNYFTDESGAVLGNHAAAPTR